MALVMGRALSEKGNIQRKKPGLHTVKIFKFGHIEKSIHKFIILLLSGSSGLQA